MKTVPKPPHGTTRVGHLLYHDDKSIYRTLTGAGCLNDTGKIRSAFSIPQAFTTFTRGKIVGPKRIQNGGLSTTKKKEARKNHN